MNTIKTIVSCLVGPKVSSFYKLGGHTLSSTTPEILSRSHRYQQSPLEATSDYVIRVSKLITSVGMYISPIILSYLMYKRNSPESYIHSLDRSVLLQLFTTALSVLIGAYCVRALARYSNPEYQTFLKILEDATNNPTISNKRILNHCDADFSAFPVDFKWSEARDKRPPAPYLTTIPSSTSTSSTFLETPLILNNSSFKLPLEFLTSIVMKTIGRRMIYPGTSSFLQALVQPAILSGRQRLIEEFGGVRHKLESYDGNQIDTMFIDRRGSSPNGDYLVICCEGNGGYYELGTILTPLEIGYSVLGWNHPGFAGSTGVPYPDQDVAAVDIVVNLALDKLGFAPSQLVVYGWSIGGFTATWAGMRHPNIHGLIIDASFDHILPLARNIFPEFLYPVIELGLRQHFDLNNSRHLAHYKGPILLIRRSRDEVIATDPYNSPPTNRGNYLLIELLRQRFPVLIDARAISLIMEYLSGNSTYQDGVLNRYSVNNGACLRLLLDYFHTNRTSYPVNIGEELDSRTRDQMVLFLASKHMIDVDSVHCAPLPARYFQRPWNLISLALSNSSL